MKLFELVTSRGEKFNNSNFCKFLRDVDNTPASKISYTNYMLHFVMGFKEVLDILYVSGSDDEMQQKVNEHCIEDNGHWRWYLNDIFKRIEYKDNYLGRDGIGLFSELWNRKDFAIRNSAYEIIHQAKMAKTPAMKMLILEIIEAVFAIYVENMNIVVHELGKWEDYEFFGKKHYDEENNHSSGTWLEGQRKLLESEIYIDPSEQQKAVSMINSIFDGVDDMFERLYEKQCEYARSEGALHL